MKPTKRGPGAAGTLVTVADFYGEKRLSPGEVAVAELVRLSPSRSEPLTRGDWVLAFRLGLLTVAVPIFLQRYSTSSTGSAESNRRRYSSWHRKEVQALLWNDYCAAKKLSDEENEKVKTQVFDQVARRVVVATLAES